MRGLVLTVSMCLFAVSCDKTPGDSTQSAAPPPPAVLPSAVGAATLAASAASLQALNALGATAAPGAAPTGPCAALADTCKRCPAGLVQMACNAALAAGAADSTACINALADKDISRQCGGAAPPSAKPTAPTATASARGAMAAGAGTAGPCAELATKCAKCPAGATKSACNFALADKDIRAQCL